MPKSRDRFKQAALNARREELLNSKNAFGVTDPTPANAVRNIRLQQIEERREIHAHR